MKKRFAIAAVLVVFGGLASVMLTASAQSGRRGAAVGRDTRPFEVRFWEYLQRAHYTNWAPVPGQSGDFYPGQSPHGKFLKMYLNRAAAGNAKELPYGSIVIKENYGPDKQTLMAVTVMYRTKGYNPDGGDWYWIKYNRDGTVANAPPEKGSVPLRGRVKSCIGCHGGADNNDFAFFND